MTTPGIFAISNKYHVSHTVAILSLSLFVLGLAIGPMIAAPISETRGRAIVYKVSMPLYMLFCFGVGYSESLTTLLVCRTFAAIAGAPCLAVGAGTVADLYESRNMASGGVLVVMAPFLGPCEYSPLNSKCDQELTGVPHRPWTSDWRSRSHIHRLPMDPVVHDRLGPSCMDSCSSYSRDPPKGSPEEKSSTNESAAPRT